MIAKALKYTRDTFNQFLTNQFGLNEEVVSINRIVDASGNIPTENNNKVTLSLIHIEEEVNQQFYNKMPRTDGGRYIVTQPPQRFNLFVLVAPNFENYEEGLKFLNASIQFFQSNALMDSNTNSNLPVGILRLEFELEKGDGYMQMHNLWTALGAKYQPSIIYKMKLITINSDEIDGFDAAITNISTDSLPE